MSYGKKINEWVSAGIQLNYYLINKMYFGNNSSINVDFSLLGRVTDQLYAGFQLHNLMPSGSDKSDQRIPFQFSSGFGYTVTKEVFLGLMIRKIENIPVDIIPEIDYNINETFSARFQVFKLLVQFIMAH